MRYIVSLLVAIIISVSAPAGAQILTVLAAKAALESAISELRNALADATNDLRSLGNSLQANAQNLIFDVDRTFKSTLHLTMKELDSAELKLMEDVQALTKQITSATSHILNEAGNEARLTIVEADIAAYNAIYSLPCRSAPPRLVASFPARLVAGRSAPILQLKGNFLRQGQISATVNGHSANIVERLDTSLTISIPEALIQSVTDSEVIASTTISGLEHINRAPRIWGLLGCSEGRYEVSEKPIGLSIIEPPLHLRLTGSLSHEYTASREISEAKQKFARTGSSQCDDNSRADEQWCVSSGTLSKVTVSAIDANCNSGFEGTVPSGDRCVLARGKVAGCGAVRGPFNTWLGCKGRGWLKYNIQLIRKETYQTTTATASIMRIGPAGTSSFAIDMPSRTSLEHPLPRYNINVEVMQGRKVVASYVVTHANPNVGPIVSRVNGGVLAIEADPSRLP